MTLSISAARNAAPSANGHPHPAAVRDARRRFLLVHNPTAGIIGDKLVRKVVARLRADGATVDVSAPRAPGAGNADPLDTAGYDAVIAAGGDGTIRALAA